MARHDWSEIVEAGRATLRFDSRRWIGGVSAPAAVVVTDDDEVVPVHRQLALAASLPQATLHRVPEGTPSARPPRSEFVPVLMDACESVAERTPSKRFATVAA